MNITSKTIEGKKWEKLYKDLTQRYYERIKTISDAKNKFGLWECEHCGTLNSLADEEVCSECGR